MAYHATTCRCQEQLVIPKSASGKSVNGLLLYSSAFKLGASASCRWIMVFGRPVLSHKPVSGQLPRPSITVGNDIVLYHAQSWAASPQRVWAHLSDVVPNRIMRIAAMKCGSMKFLDTGAFMGTNP